MDKKKVFVFGFLLVAVIIFTTAFSLNFPSNSGYDNLNNPTSVGYKGYVCVQKNHETPHCGHNQLYNLGKNMTRDALGVGGTQPILNISLCNATSGCGAPLADASELYLNYTSCGLGSTQGTYSVITADNGNYTVSRTFTVAAGCTNVEVNATRLTNATGSSFAGNSFPYTILQASDQISINWTISII